MYELSGDNIDAATKYHDAGKLFLRVGGAKALMHSLQIMELARSLYDDAGKKNLVSKVDKDMSASVLTCLNGDLDINELKQVVPHVKALAESGSEKTLVMGKYVLALIKNNCFTEAEEEYMSLVREMMTDIEISNEALCEQFVLVFLVSYCKCLYINDTSSLRVCEDTFNNRRLWVSSGSRELITKLIDAFDSSNMKAIKMHAENLLDAYNNDEVMKSLIDKITTKIEELVSTGERKVKLVKLRDEEDPIDLLK